MLKDSRLDRGDRPRRWCLLVTSRLVCSLKSHNIFYFITDTTNHISDYRKYHYCLSCVCLSVSVCLSFVCMSVCVCLSVCRDYFCKKTLSDFDITLDISWYYGQCQCFCTVTGHFQAALEDLSVWTCHSLTTDLVTCP